MMENKDVDENEDNASKWWKMMENEDDLQSIKVMKDD